MEKKEDMVIAGKIHGTHGVRGDLKIEIFPPKFKLPEKIYIKDKEGNFKELEVEVYSKKKGLVKFKGYDDIDKAKKVKHHYFYVDTSKLPKLDNDTFYEYQLLDMDVVFNDKVIGRVIKVDDRLPTAYLVIKCIDDKIRHLPFIKEFIKDVDLENKRITVTLPEGWFTL